VAGHAVRLPVLSRRPPHRDTHNFADWNDPEPIYVGTDRYGIPIYVQAYATASGEGVGAGHTVKIHQGFHSTIDTAILGAPASRPPTQMEMQAFVLLHEIGHLTGATVHTTNEIAPVNARITDACFKNFNF
jgi:hypothetical protein